MTKSNEKYFASKFAHILFRDDAFCLYHSLTQKKVYGDNSLQMLLKIFQHSITLDEAKRQLELHENSIDSTTIDRMLVDLVEIGIVITDRQQDLLTYSNLLGHGVALRDTRLLYLHPTNDCNLRCKYCFVEDEHQRPLIPCKMDIITAFQSVDIFAHLTQESDEILLNFYGGEPLLNKPVVYETMRYVRKLEEEGTFSRHVAMTLQTNGVLVDEETISVLKETGSQVSLSLDGPQKMHDAVRVGKGTCALGCLENTALLSNADGAPLGHAHIPCVTGSFQQAFSAYRRLQDADVSVSPSVTLSSANIYHTDEVIDFIVNELKPKSMGFNPLIPRLCGSNPVDTDPEFTTQQLIKAFKRLREHGIYEDRVMRRVRPYTEERFHFKDCMGVGGQLAVSPQGKIGPCQAYLGCDEFFPLDVHALHAKLPDLTVDDIYADPMFHEWSYRFPLNMKDCIDCHAIAVCGGGCPYAAHANAGSVWKIDNRICHQAKQIFEWLIWETYDAMLASQA